MSTGIKYVEKKGSYIITFDDNYTQKVLKSIIADLMAYHVEGNIYNISYSKLIDLIYKHATVRPLSSSILMNKKQFILSYIHEKLPESFAYREMLIDMASKLNDIESIDKKQIQPVLENIDSELHDFLRSLQVHLYGTCSSTYMTCGIYQKDPLYSKDGVSYSKTSINMSLKRIVDDCVKYLKSDYETIVCGNGFISRYSKTI